MQAITRKTRLLDVSYNASNNELVSSSRSNSSRISSNSSSNSSSNRKGRRSAHISMRAIGAVAAALHRLEQEQQLTMCLACVSASEAQYIASSYVRERGLS